MSREPPSSPSSIAMARKDSKTGGTKKSLSRETSLTRKKPGEDPVHHRRSASVPVLPAPVPAPPATGLVSASAFASRPGTGGYPPHQRTKQQQPERYRHLYPDVGEMNLLSVVEGVRGVKEKEKGRDGKHPHQQEEEEGEGDERGRTRLPSREQPFQTPLQPLTQGRPAPSSAVSVGPPARDKDNAGTSKSPLRSALKRSRTPSPCPVQNLEVEPADPVRRILFQREMQEKNLNGGEVGKGKKERDDDGRDDASVSSYETGREVLLDDRDAGGGGGGAPPVEETLVFPKGNEQENGDENVGRKDTNGGGGGFAVDEGGGKEKEVNGFARALPVNGEEVNGFSRALPVNGEEVKRRKSVRVSLQPTFSPDPPPVVYDSSSSGGPGLAPKRSTTTTITTRGNESWYGEEDWDVPAKGKAAGGKKKKKKKKEKREVKAWEDVWEDSSEEDEEYSRAKILLGRVGGGVGKSKGKGRL